MRCRLRWAVVSVVVAFALAGCEKEPPDLPSGHVSWLDASGSPRLVLRAKPYGFRVLAGDATWARVVRDAGEVRLEGQGRIPVLAQQTPEGARVKHAAGEVRAEVRVTKDGAALLDRAAAPLGRLVLENGRVLVYNAGGLPLGTVTPANGALVLRGGDAAISGTVVGCNDPLAAGILMLEGLPLEDRVALFAMRAGR
jgi:hypothetical protein